MTSIIRRSPVRNNRVRYLRTLGCPARRRWLRPFTVRVFAVVRHADAGGAR